MLANALLNSFASGGKLNAQLREPFEDLGDCCESVVPKPNIEGRLSINAGKDGEESSKVSKPHAKFKHLISNISGDPGGPKNFHGKNNFHLGRGNAGKSKANKLNFNHTTVNFHNKNPTRGKAGPNKSIDMFYASNKFPSTVHRDSTNQNQTVNKFWKPSRNIMHQSKSDFAFSPAKNLDMTASANFFHRPGTLLANNARIKAQKEVNKTNIEIGQVSRCDDWVKGKLEAKKLFAHQKRALSMDQINSNL
jgi:hypothetical protein